MPAAGNKRRNRWHPLLDESDARDPLQVLLDRVLETPQAQGIFGQMQDLIDRAGNAIDPARRPPQQPPRRAAPPPPPAPAAPDPLLTARAIMHFGPTETLTKERITKQRRTLASICHPDKGGSTEAMQRLNHAADLLLAQHK
jgi:hypothetical protein